MKLKLLFLFAALTFVINSEDFDISKFSFEINDLTNYKNTFSNVNSSVYNIAYSSILPANGIYMIYDEKTGKESIIQIGYAMVKTPPQNIYMTKDMFTFFSAGNVDPVVKVKIRFLGWASGKENDSDFLNIKSLVVEPDKSLDEIKLAGDNKYFIQLGSFNYYQNSFPKITELLPYLELRPNFFMMKHLNNNETAYRVLAGPYTKEDADKIMKIINKTAKDKDKVFIKSAGKIVKESQIYTPETVK